MVATTTQTKANRSAATEFGRSPRRQIPRHQSIPRLTMTASMLGASSTSFSRGRARRLSSLLGEMLSLDT
jgi:hypothetical protein